MNKLLLFVGSFLLMWGSVNAQVVEVSGFYGYQFNGRLNTYYGKYDVKDNPNYGGVLGLEVRGNTFVEFSYNRNESEFTYTRNNIIQSNTVKMATEYYMLGSIRQFGIDDKIKPFAGATAGLVRFHPKSKVDFDGDEKYTTIDDAYRFGVCLQAGLKYFFNNKIGLRLQGNLLLPLDVNGLFISGGTGGANGGVSFNVPMVSGNFSGGLILRLNN